MVRSQRLIEEGIKGREMSGEGIRGRNPLEGVRMFGSKLIADC